MTRTFTDRNLALEVLQLLNIKGRGTIAGLSEALSATEDRVTAAIGDAVGEGLCQGVGISVWLTAEGRRRLARLLDEERNGIDIARLVELYGEFDGLSAELRSLVTAVRIQSEKAPNGRADTRYNASTADRLVDFDHRFGDLLGRIVAAVPRLAYYPSRFAAAISEIRAGSREFVTSPVVDSYQQVWLELNEDLISLLGQGEAERAAVEEKTEASATHSSLQAPSMPDRHAVITVPSGARVTYHDVEQRSVQLARLLDQLDFPRDCTVAMVAENRPEWAEVTWAALRSGRFIAPVNCRLGVREAGEVLRAAEADVVVTSAKYAAVVMEAARDVPRLRKILVLDEGNDVGASEGVSAGAPKCVSYQDVLEGVPASPLVNERLGGRVMFSSGTTGTPKAIRHNGADIHPLAASPHLGPYTDLFSFDSETVYLSPAPTYHTAPFRFLVAVTQLGGTVVSMERFDPVAALEAIERYRVTHAQFVPTMLWRMVRLPDEVKQRFDLSSLRVAITGAAACPHELKTRIMEWWGPVVHELYGASEGYGNCHIGPDEVSAHPGSVGRALQGVIHITDDEGRDLPTGEVGTVWFEGAGAFEYERDDTKTQASRHPAGWRTVGDLGYLDSEGYLYLAGRRDHLIIRGGVNIHPQEVEDTLMLHPEVDDVAVIGMPDVEYGQVVAAVVVPSNPAATGGDLDARLISFCRERLAHYKCPTSVELVTELPRGENGKMYKKELLRERANRTDNA